MDKNAERIDRLKKITGSLTDIELAETFSNENRKIDASRVNYWREKGFHASTANILDYLLDMIEQGRAPEQKYTAAEVSEITGVGEAKIRRLARDGKLPGVFKKHSVWAFTNESIKHLKTK